MGERSSIQDPPGHSPVWWRGPVGVRVGTGGSGLGPWVRWVLRTGGRGAKRPRTSVIQPALHRGVWPLPRWRQRRALPAPPAPPLSSRGLPREHRRGRGLGGLGQWVPPVGCAPACLFPGRSDRPDLVNFGHLRGISL